MTTTGRSPRSDNDSAFLLRAGRNRWLGAAVALSPALPVVVVHGPALDAPSRTVPLSIGYWLPALALASSVLWVGELRKLVRRRRSPRIC